MSAASDVMSTPSPEQSLCPKAFCRERAALVIVQKLTIGNVDRELAAGPPPPRKRKGCRSRPQAEPLRFPSRRATPA